MPHKYQTLKMRQITRNEDQPRETFNEEALNELAASIKQHGLLQPIVVRKAEQGYELVAGERRFRANAIAGNITIEAKILLADGDAEISDLDSFKKAMAENLNREDMLPMEEARGFKRVLDDEHDGDPDKVPAVAETFSKSVPFVNQRLTLLNLRPEIQAAVDAKHIGTQAAVQIAALSPGNQKAVFDDWKKGDKTDNQLVHIAYAMRKQEKAAKQDSMVDVEEMTPEKKAELGRAQAKTKSDLDAIEHMCELLGGIAKTDPMELARMLDGQVGKRLEQMDRVAEYVQKARWQLKQAKAHADASELMVSPDAAAPDLVGDAAAALARLEPAGADASEQAGAPAQGEPAAPEEDQGEAVAETDISPQADIQQQENTQEADPAVEPEQEDADTSAEGEPVDLAA
ncbi:MULTISPECIES: ParB/RepB/Spo0J family partition protein [unclassified Streptomyces]|uniref:ParB/RepB/Spo0J family partition protein n=1 Tax=unclassified Streptomyces TaxID=2593676 RepID=UPI001E2C6B8D|nr:ParB/RepB/Spo0J family partition protein [Streptomyces sp. CB02980]MCB8906737.1 ParB/RepB/Spo0J family partition protein [Streptomyces sp. CB02980]